MKYHLYLFVHILHHLEIRGWLIYYSEAYFCYSPFPNVPNVGKSV